MVDWKGWGRKGRGLIEILALNLFSGTEGNHKSIILVAND